MRRTGESPDQGQNQLEYVGLVVLIGGVIAAIAAASFTTTIPRKFRAAVCHVFSDDCPDVGKPRALSPEQRPDAYYRPDRCRLATTKQQYGAHVTAYSVRVRGGVKFSVKRMSNGHVRVTAIGGAGVGGIASAGPAWSWGKVVRGGAEVEGSVEAGVHVGDTWTFENPKAANEFLVRRARNRVLTSVEPGIGAAAKVGEWITGVNPLQPNYPDITRLRVDVKGKVNGWLGLSVGTHRGTHRRRGGNGSHTSGNHHGKHRANDGRASRGATRRELAERDNRRTSPGFDGELTLKGSEGAILAIDHEQHERSLTYQLKGKVAGGIYLGGTPITVNDFTSAGRARFEGTVKVTMDSRDQIKLVRVTRTTAANGASNHKSKAVVVRLEPKNARQRRLVRGWLLDQAGGPVAMTHGSDATPGFPWVHMYPPSVAAADTPFKRLLYREAHVSKVTYANETTPYKYGASVGEGLTFGGGVGYTKSGSHVVDAQYLDAPREGKREFIPFVACHR